MKQQQSWKYRAVLGCAAVLAATTWTGAQEPQALEFVDSDLREIMPGYRPNLLRLADTAPESLKKVPDSDTSIIIIRHKDIRGQALAKAIKAALAAREKAE